MLQVTAIERPEPLGGLRKGESLQHDGAQQGQAGTAVVEDLEPSAQLPALGGKESQVDQVTGPEHVVTPGDAAVRGGHGTARMRSG
jgi:hypothetical protein